MEKYGETLIRAIAESQHISMKEALDHVETCIQLICIEHGYQYDFVHAIIMTPEFMNLCLRDSKQCDQRSLEECEQSCSCVVYEGRCLPRYFENAEIMNRDPDKYAKTLSTADLEALVKFASHLYYNYDGGNMTDNTYDALEYALKKRLKVKHRLYEKMGAPPIDKIRVTLPYPIGTLQKVKPGTRELREFLHAPHDHQLIWSEKLDGNSGYVVYHQGQPQAIYTKGDGTVGGDVSYLIGIIPLPTITDPKYQSIVVRGEFMIPKSIFERKYKSSYSFPRSFVTSKMNSGFISPGLSDIEFVAYQILDCPGLAPAKHQLQVFTLLEFLKFHVPSYGLLYQRSEALLMIQYKHQREHSPYAIDGLVITFDQSFESWRAQPRSVAFKMILEEQIRSTKVIDIDWGISRYGRYVPVAVYNAVYIDGARLHRASAFNAAHVRDWSLGRGTKITIVRSGDVIPQIKDVVTDESIEPIFPLAEPSWHWEDRDIVLDDIEGNRMVQIKRSSFFFETIRVPRLRIGTLEKMYDHGLKTLHDITHASESDFRQVKGIGAKTAKAFYDNIHGTLRVSRMDRLVVASTTFKSGLGRKLIKTLVRTYPTLFTLKESEIKTMMTRQKLKGFGPKRIDQVAKQVPEFMNFMYSLNKEDIEEALRHDMERIQRLTSPHPDIVGKSFVLSGFMGDPNYELEDFIDDNHGMIAHHVDKSTAAVIMGSMGMITDKMMQAYELQIPIYSVDEFEAMYHYSTRVHDETQ